MLSVLAVAALSMSACELTGGNDITVLDGDVVADSPLIADVKKALRNNAQTALLRLTVTGDGDVIILKGSVNNDQEYTSAEQVASSVPGVRHVINNIYRRD